MDTIFMNSENSKTSDPHTLIFNLTDKKQGVPKNESHNYRSIMLPFKIVIIKKDLHW